jgi:hypothetical protein
MGIGMPISQSSTERISQPPNCCFEVHKLWCRPTVPLALCS